jgi:hypothetical protein
VLRCGPDRECLALFKESNRSWDLNPLSGVSKCGGSAVERPNGVSLLLFCKRASSRMFCAAQALVNVADKRQDLVADKAGIRSSVGRIAHVLLVQATILSSTALGLVCNSLTAATNSSSNSSNTVLPHFWGPLSIGTAEAGTLLSRLRWPRAHPGDWYHHDPPVISCPLLAWLSQHRRLRVQAGLWKSQSSR